MTDEPMTDVLRWRAPGPVSAAFLRSRARVPAINGPVGSGKTSTVFRKMLLRAIAQPVMVDGVKRYACCVVRKTYRDLWRSTIKSWWRWFPKDQGKWVGADGDPATHLLELDTVDPRTGRSCRVDMRVDFVAIGDSSAEDVLRGYEVTDFYLNEADTLANEVYTYANGRVGRYPAGGGANPYGLLLDFNAPVFGSWVADLMDGARMGSDVEVYIQPPGLLESGGRLVANEEAENLDNLPPDYYAAQLVPGVDDMYVRRMLCNKRGYSRDGKPVFPEFRDDLHVAQVDLEPIPNLPLEIGSDAGRTPALVIGQRNPFGQWLILDELCALDMGVEAFADATNHLLSSRYRDWTRPARKGGSDLPIRGWGDPASDNASDTTRDEDTWLRIYARHTGIRWRAAPGGNRLTPRLEVVRRPLTTMASQGRPGILVSPRCTKLRQGFAAGYRWRRIQIAGEERFDEKPDKNEFSHVHDALQNLLLGGGGFDDVMERRRSREARDRSEYADSE